MLEVDTTIVNFADSEVEGGTKVVGEAELVASYSNIRLQNVQLGT